MTDHKLPTRGRYMQSTGAATARTPQTPETLTPNIAPNAGRRESILYYLAICIVVAVFSFQKTEPLLLLFGLVSLVACIILSVKWWITDLG